MDNSKSLQQISTLKLLPKIKENYENRCQRAKVDIGTFCNYNCYFCYYKHKLNEKTSSDIIFKRIKKLYELGCRDFDISGGEPSIDKNLPEYIKYIKSLDINNKISCLSNGYGFTNINRLKELKDLGLSEILFSLHGTKNTHDLIVQTENAFEKIIKAIKNAISLNMKVRINSTITSINYKEINTEFLETLKELNLDKISQINFLPLNYFDQNRNNSEEFDYESISCEFKKFIDYTRSIQDKIEVNIRYFPLCYMKGYEKYVKTYYDHIFDKGDWNICWYSYKEDSVDNFYKTILDQRISRYLKFDECKKCKYFDRCDGIEKESKNFKIYPV